MLLAWSTDQDFWIRRASITAQLSAKGATDTDLLACVIEANMADPEFFIRKAIGWVLREYAKTEPGWVLEFVAKRRIPQPALAQGSPEKRPGQMTGRVVTGWSDLLKSSLVSGSRKIR